MLSMISDETLKKIAEWENGHLRGYSDDFWHLYEVEIAQKKETTCRAILNLPL
jgi:hypothetical protein